MSRLLFYIPVIFLCSSICRAQSCKVEEITLKAKIEANPGAVLHALGDAIALYPHCMSGFIETAIVAANPDDATLTEIIKLAVSEYPLESGTIAEAAVLASPEKVDVIRQAFITPKEPIMATPVEENPAKRSPIENFLTNYKPEPEELIEEPTVPTVIDVLPETSVADTISQQPAPEDIAANALRAIDELIVKLKANQSHDGCVADSGMASALTLHNNVEEFSLNMPDYTVLTTINDAGHHDRTDENITAENPLIFEDPVTELSLAEYLKQEINTSPVAEKKSAGQSGKVAFTSSVYPIPAPGSEGSTPAEIKSATVSPTLPQTRR